MRKLVTHRLVKTMPVESFLCTEMCVAKESGPGDDENRIDKGPTALVIPKYCRGVLDILAWSLYVWREVITFQLHSFLQNLQSITEVSFESSTAMRQTGRRTAEMRLQGSVFLFCCFTGVMIVLSFISILSISTNPANLTAFIVADSECITNVLHAGFLLGMYSHYVNTGNQRYLFIPLTMFALAFAALLPLSVAFVAYAADTGDFSGTLVLSLLVGFGLALSATLFSILWKPRNFSTGQWVNAWFKTIRW